MSDYVLIRTISNGQTKTVINPNYELYTGDDGKQRFRLRTSASQNPDTFKSMTDSFNKIFKEKP